MLGLSAANSDTALATPSAPGVPEVIELDENVTLAWLRPDHDGIAGDIIGYRVCGRMRLPI